MKNLIEKKIGNEVDRSIISELFDGCVFKITEDSTKRFRHEKWNPHLGTKKNSLEGSTLFRFKRGNHRHGIRERMLPRGCIVSPDIRILNMKIVTIVPRASLHFLKTHPLPNRKGPKKANKILKDFGLLEMYNKKKQNKKEKLLDI